MLNFLKGESGAKDQNREKEAHPSLLRAALFMKEIGRGSVRDGNGELRSGLMVLNTKVGF